MSTSCYPHRRGRHRLVGTRATTIALQEGKLTQPTHLDSGLSVSKERSWTSLGGSVSDCECARDT